MDDIIYKCVLISFCLTGLSFNVGVLIWKFSFRKWNRINTFFTINLTVTNILSSTFLLILSVSAVIGLVRKTDANQYEEQNKYLCKITTFIQNFAYEAKLGFLLLKCFDVIKSVRNASSGNGLSTNKILTFGIVVWFISIAVAVVQFIPVPYFLNDMDLEEIPGELCSHIENLHNRTAGWEYSFALHLGLNGFIYLACTVSVIVAIILRKHSSFGQLTDDEHKEQLFLLQTGVLCFVDFICWTPSIVLGVHVLMSHIRNVTFLSADILRWMTLLTASGHTILNPIIIIATTTRSSSCDVQEFNSGDSMGNNSWTSQRNTNIKLSKYLETVGALSPQATVVMTASLSRSLDNLYKLGMTTNIHPDNIYMEHDEYGTVINSRLSGVPKRPTAMTLAEQMQEDNNKIAELFESMMQRFNDLGKKSGNVSFKSKASVKMKHSLSMKESRGIRSVKTRLRTNSERNFKSSHDAASIHNVYIIGSVDDLARRVDTLRKKNKGLSLKLHRTVNLSIDSDFSVGESNASANSGQSNESAPQINEANGDTGGKLGVIVENNHI